MTLARLTSRTTAAPDSATRMAATLNDAIEPAAVRSSASASSHSSGRASSWAGRGGVFRQVLQPLIGACQILGRDESLHAGPAIECLGVAVNPAPRSTRIGRPKLECNAGQAFRVKSQRLPRLRNAVLVRDHW